MNYIDKIKKLLMEDNQNIDDTYANVYALLVLVTGENTTLENVHDAWSVLKNPIRPDHKSLIPFDELTKEVQDLDQEFVDSIRKVARMVK